MGAVTRKVSSPEQGPGNSYRARNYSGIGLSTEALPLTSIGDKELSVLYARDETQKDGLCVGYPLKGTALKIMAIRDDTVPIFSEVRFLGYNQVGEIVVCGPNVSEAYWMDAQANALAKIYDAASRGIWHRTGDLGRIDGEGRLWFYGRKSHRIISSGRVHFTIPVEAIFNQHPCVARSALVGVAKADDQDKIPVICIERVKNKKRRIYLHEELRAMASGNSSTRDIEVFLFHRKFPVDPRHNAKIFREKLAEWARIKMKL